MSESTNLHFQGALRARPRSHQPGRFTGLLQPHLQGRTSKRHGCQRGLLPLRSAQSPAAWCWSAPVLPTPKPDRFLHAGGPPARVQRDMAREWKTPQEEEEGSQTLPEVKSVDLSVYQHNNTGTQ